MRRLGVRNLRGFDGGACFLSRVGSEVHRMACLDVHVEGASVGVLDVSEVVGEFLVREEVLGFGARGH